MAVVVAGAVAVAAAAVEVVAGVVATLPLLVTAAGKAHVATLMASVTPRALTLFRPLTGMMIFNTALILAWSTASSGMFA